MSTPQSEVIDNFRSEFQSIEVLPDGLENQFFLNALGDFQLNLYDLEYDKTAQTMKDLTLSEIGLLSDLMYKHYLKRERDRILKINNLIGRDIKLTAMGEAKSQMNKAYTEYLDELEGKIDKFKDNSYYG